MAAIKPFLALIFIVAVGIALYAFIFKLDDIIGGINGW